MSAEESRRIALQWLQCLTEARLDDLFALGAPDATWWISGLKETSSITGTHPYAAREKHIRETFEGQKSWDFTLKGITAEGDTVVVEGSPRVEIKDGRVYENDVVFKFVIRDGKIQSLRGYVDWAAVLNFMATKA